MEALREIFHEKSSTGPDVTSYGSFSVIATLEFLQHHFSEMGHGNTSCDPHLHQTIEQPTLTLPHAKRPPPGDFVQVALPVKFVPVLHLQLSVCAVIGLPAPCAVGEETETEPQELWFHSASERVMFKR